MSTSDGQAAGAKETMRIELEPAQFWWLGALVQSSAIGGGEGGDVRRVLEYLAASVFDGLERPGSWESDCMQQLFDEWPFRSEPRALTRAIEFEVPAVVCGRLKDMALLAGGKGEDAPRVMEHVVMAVCEAAAIEHRCAKMLFGEWPAVRQLQCSSCATDVFAASDLEVHPEGSLCPSCAADEKDGNGGSD